MTPQHRTQVIITVASLALVGVHLVWPNLRVDAVTLILLAAAAIPWLLPLFKSVELPGGLKLEFQDLQAAEQRAAEAGLLDEPPDPAPLPRILFSGCCRRRRKLGACRAADRNRKTDWVVWLRALV